MLFDSLRAKAALGSIAILSAIAGCGGSTAQPTFAPVPNNTVTDKSKPPAPPKGVAPDANGKGNVSANPGGFKQGE